MQVQVKVDVQVQVRVQVKVDVQVKVHLPDRTLLPNTPSRYCMTISAVCSLAPSCCHPALAQSLSPNSARISGKTMSWRRAK